MPLTRRWSAWAQEARLLNNPPPFPLNIDETNHVMAFHRGGLVFVFNWSGDRAIMDYMLPVPQKGEWRVVLDTDNARFGGFGRQDVSMPHFTDGDGNLSLYLLPRTALVLKRVGSAVMGPPPGAGGLACGLKKTGGFIGSVHERGVRYGPAYRARDE